MKVASLDASGGTIRLRGKLSTSLYASSAGDIVILYMSLGCNGVISPEPLCMWRAFFVDDEVKVGKFKMNQMVCHVWG